MTLYEINQAMLECIDPETGEVDFEQLTALDMLRDEKVENIALWIKDLSAEADALKSEKMSFAARQSAAEKKAESLKRYLIATMEGQKFKTTRCAITFRKTERVEITNELELPPEYTSVEIKADKTAIKAAIKEGKKITGAQLVEGTSCIIK